MSINNPPQVTYASLRPDLQIIADFIPAGAKVLDLGCADGELLEFLVRQRGVKGRGIELSEAGVLTCVGRGLSVRQGLLQEGLADYPDHSFDFTVLSQTLPFLDDPEMILGEMLRVGNACDRQLPELGLLALPPGAALHGPHAASARSAAELACQAPLAGLHHHGFRRLLPRNRHADQSMGFPGRRPADADTPVH